MPPRRDFLKATAALVLATGAAWLATHAHGAASDAADRQPRSAVEPPDPAAGRGELPPIPQP